MLRRRTPTSTAFESNSIRRRLVPSRHLSVTLSLIILILLFSTFLILQSVKMDARRLRHSADHVYTDATAPYKNEPVAEYRSRLDQDLRVRTGPTIFVSIASYRDEACPGTITDLFWKAANPSRITIGLVDQTNLEDPDTDDVFCESLLTPQQRRQVRLIRVSHRNARGPTYARYLASKLWEYETYFMQIDAHTQFADNWDDKLIANLEAMPVPESFVITHYPPGTPDEFSAESPVPWICAPEDHEQAPRGLFVQAQGQCLPPNMSDDLPAGTCVSPFLGGGLMFGRATLLKDAPYDKYLDYLFHGEEVLIAARLWTRGYTLVTPRQNVVSHTYGGREKNVYGDGIDVDVARRSEARVRWLLDATLDEDNEDDIDLNEVNELGMGFERPIQDYLEFAGLGGMSERVFQTRCQQRYDQGKWVDVVN